MAARQRLRAVLDARRASPCWRCALNPPRYNSTSPVGDLDTSKSTDGVPLDQTLPGLQDPLKSDVRPVSRTMYKSRIASMQAAHRPRIRVMSDGRPVALGSPSQSQSMEVDHKPRIRITVDGRPVALSTQTSLRFKKFLARDLVPKKVLSTPKHKLDPVIRTFIKKPRSLEDTSTRGPLETNMGKKLPAENDQGDSVDTEAMSPWIRKTWGKDGNTTWEPNILNGNSTTDESLSWPVERPSQDTKYSKAIERFQDFMANKYRAGVHLIEDSIIKKHLVGNNAPRIRQFISKVRSSWKHNLSVAKGDDATSLVHIVATEASEVPSKVQREDEDFHDALTSLLDVIRDFPISKLPTPTRKIRQSISSTRFPPQPRLVRRVSFSGSRTLNRQAPVRRYATATSQTLEADAQIDSTAVGANPDGLLKGTSGGIREALKLWQEQHDIALADTLGRPPSSTLSDTQNLFTQSGEDESFTAIARDDEVDDDDDLDFRSDEPIPDIFAHQVFLRRGDLVELMAASEPVLAVFVRNVADQCQFYTIRGEWVHRDPGGARWAVSRFVNPDDLNEILPYLPAEEVAEEKMNRLQPVDVHAPRDAGAKVIDQMLLFHQTADAVFREHADRINRLYEIIAPSEAFAGRTYMSLKDIATKVLMKEDPSELTQPMMWTIHRAIAQNQNLIWDQMNYRQNPIYEIYPQQGLKYISQVREWVREYQEGIIQDSTNESMSSIDATLMAATRSLNPLATFVKKARAAIQQSRQTRPLSKSGFIGPSSTKIAIDENLGMPYREILMQEFDDKERIIIHYLDVWATSSYVNAYTNLASVGPMILRAVGMYEDFELDESTGFTLLQELGVVTPWENRTVYKLRNLKLPGHDSGSGEASSLLRDCRKEVKVFEPKDSMEGLRKDWGDMPVFCIDSADTLERDDGVSLELVDNDLSAYWVHVHVANPSAFIIPDSAMAKYAASIGESVYFPERKYPMLNPKVTRDQLSLANDRPCITFSAKISVDGDILEKKVSPGIVRNVYYLTPRMVGQGLGLTETNEALETVSILTVGGQMPSQPIDDVDQTGKALSDPGHIEILHKLLELGEAARHKRAQAGAPEFYSSARIATTYPIVYLAKYAAGKYFKIEDRNVRQFEGDPIITLQRTTEAYGLVAKMVADLMIIAGDVGASWCSERNIPIPYRGILRNPEPASPPEVFKREILDPKIAKYGHAEQNDLLRYMRLVGQPQVSDRPLHHHALGLPAYCKATSPLRRHIDLYTHWQIEAALRHEAATGTSLIGSTDDSYLPFSRAQVEEFAGGTIHREKRITLAKTSSTRHWICQALFRAFYFQEAALPETFEVTGVHGRARNGHHPGWLSTWNVKVQVREDSAAVMKEGGWRVGDVWEARLIGVDPYHKNIDMEPIRLIEREGGRLVV